MFSPEEMTSALLYEMGSFCCAMGTSVCSIIPDVKEGCGDLVVLCGQTPPYLSDLPALGRVFLQLWF